MSLVGKCPFVRECLFFVTKRSLSPKFTPKSLGDRNLDTN